MHIVNVATLVWPIIHIGYALVVDLVSNDDKCLCCTLVCTYVPSCVFL